MKKTIIVGAGPVGLYLALKLHDAGVTNLLIIDPRAGTYTRPGHILNEVFKKAEEGLGISFWGNNDGHIKNIERCLYALAKKKDIEIQNYSFKKIIGNNHCKGIIANNGDTDLMLECDQLFDCSGKYRCVIHAVNSEFSPEEHPFLLRNIVNCIPVKNHFLAYVHLEETIIKQLDYYEIHKHQGFSKTIENQLMAPLKKLGWKNYSPPIIYSYPFKKDKHCLYLQAPEDLSPTQYDEWVKAVLIYASSNPTSISYAASYRKITKLGRPYFQYFEVVPQKVTPAVFTHDCYPTIYCHGDTLIDPLYYLAHGICNSFERVNIFTNNISISDNIIIPSSSYQEKLHMSVLQHEEELINHYIEAVANNHGVNEDVLFEQSPKFHQVRRELTIYCKTQRFFKEDEVPKRKTCLSSSNFSEDASHCQI